MDNLGQILGIVVVVLYYVIKAVLARRHEGGDDAGAADYELEPPPRPTSQDGLDPAGAYPADPDADGGRLLGDYDPEPAPAASGFAAEREELASHLDELAARGERLAASIRHDRANQKFIPVLEGFVA